MIVSPTSRLESAKDVHISISRRTKSRMNSAYDPLSQNDQMQPEQPTKNPNVPFATLLLLALTNFGIGAASSLLFALATPYFEKVLSSGSILSHAVWIIGPISGLIVAPLVGVLSDRCTSPYGRRRPFIAYGTVAMAVGLLVFANARQLAAFLAPPSSARHTSVARGVAVIAFALIFVAINWSQWPARALMGDVVPEAQQHVLQAMLVMVMSLADLFVNAMIHSYQQPVMHAEFLFAIVAVMFIASKGMLLVIARETPLHRQPDHHHLHHNSGDNDTNDDIDSAHASARDRAKTAAVASLMYVRQMPRWMWHVGATTAMSGFMSFCTRPSASNWLATFVLGGHPQAAKGSAEAALYEKGVSIYGKASMKRTLVQIVFSIMYPKMIQAGLLPSHFVGISHAICALVLFLFSRTHDPEVAQWVIMSLALPTVSYFAATNSVVVALSSPGRRGLNLGIINCFAVIPHLIDTAYTGFLSKAFGESAVILVGAFWGFATAVVAFVFTW